MNPFGVEHTPISKARGAKQGLKLVKAAGEDARFAQKLKGGNLRGAVAGGGNKGSKMGQGWKDRIKRAQSGDMD